MPINSEHWDHGLYPSSDAHTPGSDSELKKGTSSTYNLAAPLLDRLLWPFFFFYGEELSLTTVLSSSE